MTSEHLKDGECAQCHLRAYSNCSHRSDKPSPKKKQKTRGGSADLSSTPIDLTASPSPSSRVTVQPPPRSQAELSGFLTLETPPRAPHRSASQQVSPLANPQVARSLGTDAVRGPRFDSFGNRINYTEGGRHITGLQRIELAGVLAAGSAALLTGQGSFPFREHASSGSSGSSAQSVRQNIPQSSPVTPTPPGSGSNPGGLTHPSRPLSSYTYEMSSSGRLRDRIDDFPVRRNRRLPVRSASSSSSDLNPRSAPGSPSAQPSPQPGPSNAPDQGGNSPSRQGSPQVPESPNSPRGAT